MNNETNLNLLHLIFSNQKFNNDGIIVENLLILNSLRLPKSIVDAINNKVKATQLGQQKEQELKQVQADSAKEVTKAYGSAAAIKAMADAKAYENEKLNTTLTPALIRLKEIEAWEKGGSQVPTYMSGQSGSFNFLMNQK